MIEEIDEHCIEKGRYGFTLPYLYHRGMLKNEVNSIEDLLLYFSQAKMQYIIVYCDDLDEYILGLHKQEYSRLEDYDCFNNLYYDQDLIGKRETIKDLADFFVKKYQVRIDNKTYSKNIDTGVWE